MKKKSQDFTPRRMEGYFKNNRGEVPMLEGAKK